MKLPMLLEVIATGTATAPLVFLVVLGRGIAVRPAGLVFLLLALALVHILNWVVNLVRKQMLQVFIIHLVVLFLAIKVL